MYDDDRDVSDVMLTTLKFLLFSRVKRTSTNLSYSLYNPDAPRSQKGNKYVVKRVPYNIFSRGVPKGRDDE